MAQLNAKPRLQAAAGHAAAASRCAAVPLLPVRRFSCAGREAQRGAPTTQRPSNSVCVPHAYLWPAASPAEKDDDQTPEVLSAAAGAVAKFVSQVLLAAVSVAAVLLSNVMGTAQQQKQAQLSRASPAAATAIAEPPAGILQVGSMVSLGCMLADTRVGSTHTV
jgi:hypothetical protein